MKVFVTGALGFIGRALVERYRADGAEVRGMDRMAEAAFGVVAGDVTDPGKWQDTIRGCEVVIHTAAIVSNVAAGDAIWKVNVLGTRRVLDAAIAAGARRFIHLSSVAAYGFDFPDGVDESYPLRPNGDSYVDTKVAAEQLVLQAHAAGELACSIVRPADVYGPGSRPWTVLPVEMIRSGQFALPENGRGIFSPVYVDNLIEGIQSVARLETAAGQVFNLGDGVGVETRTFFGHYSRMLGKGPIRSVPTAIAIPLADLAGGALRLLGHESEISGASMRMLARRATYSIDKARRLLGYEPKIDLDEGMRRSERWLTDRGLLR